MASPHQFPASSHHTAEWVLEFVLRQHSVTDPMANELLHASPLTPSLVSPRLKRSILLRRLSTDLSCRSISDHHTLHSLELLHDLNRPSPPSHTMKAAYCSVAIHCAVAALRAGGTATFADAVDRIWNRRIADLERSEARDLVSDWAVDSRASMELAVSGGDVREELLGIDTETEAVDAVAAYWKEAEEALGPSFLELAAAAIEAEIGEGETGLEGVMARLLRPPDRDVDGEAAAKGGDVFINEGSATNETVIDDSYEEEERLRTPEASKTTEALKTSYVNPIPTPEVSKVTEALKTSCVDLQNVVSDPLPHAVATACAVVTSRVTGGEPVDRDTPTPAAEEGVGVGQAESFGKGTVQDGDNAMEETSSSSTYLTSACKLDENQRETTAQSGGNATRGEGADTGKARGKDPLLPRPSLMARNPTARTFEWEDDSIDSPSDNSSNPSKKLPSPKRTAVSPLKLRQEKTFTRRRKMKKWTPLEEETLREAVKRHGVGCWRNIRIDYSEVFQDRTEGDLKDKWRNLTRR